MDAITTTQSAPRIAAPARLLPAVRNPDLLALALILPAPCLSALVGLILGKGAIGAVLWALAKVWMLVLPLWWRVKVDGEPLSFSPARKGGLGVAAALGLVISAIIVGAWLIIGPTWIEPGALRAAVEPVGLTNPAIYLGVAAFWILGNSVLEEYVYRWFVYERATGLVGRRWAMVLSAGAFVLHHALSMAAFFDWKTTTLCCVGVFVGGLIWSWLYDRYQTLWAPYLSHAIVDVAVFAVGGAMIFGLAG